MGLGVNVSVPQQPTLITGEKTFGGFNPPSSLEPVKEAAIAVAVIVAAALLLRKVL